MKISIAIMAHPSRKKEAHLLSLRLNKMPFHGVSLIFDNGEGEWSTGARALSAHTDSNWHIVIQDDAIISTYFYENVLNALNKVPYESLVSLYTGKVRPYAPAVNHAVGRAEKRQSSWLSGVTLFWGVCIAIPTTQIDAVLEHSKRRKEVYDRRIGHYYFKNKLPVYYSYPSLVDHDHKLGSLIGNDKSEEPRVAHKYQPNHQYSWNSQVIQI